MNAPPFRLSRGKFVVFAIGACCMAVVVARAQSPGQSGGTRSGSAPDITAGGMEAEREQIWNSPNMLRARAWLQDYCSKSARVTPEMAKRYQTELENMTPTQLQLWLLKFDHEEEQRQQQYAMWQQTHSSALAQAMSANRAARQSYADINREESEAAEGAESQINEQRELTQTEQETRQLAPIGPYGPWGYGGVHYHFHLYPY